MEDMKAMEDRDMVARIAERLVQEYEDLEGGYAHLEFFKKLIDFMPRDIQVIIDFGFAMAPRRKDNK